MIMSGTNLCRLIRVPASGYDFIKPKSNVTSECEARRYENNLLTFFFVTLYFKIVVFLVLPTNNIYCSTYVEEDSYGRR